MIHLHRSIFNTLILLFPLIMLLFADDLSSQKPVIYCDYHTLSGYYTLSHNAVTYATSA